MHFVVKDRARPAAGRVEDDAGRLIFRDGWPERVERDEATRQVGAAAIATLVEKQRRQWSGATQRALLGRLSLALRGQGLRRLLGDQQSAERVQVASEDAQGQISLKTDLGMVAATFHAVAGLQGANGGLDARMPLSGLAKLDGGCLQLLGRLFCAGLGKAWMLDDLQELHLVVRGMKSAIQR